MRAIPGSGDCQARIGDWGQPALLGTSLAYLAAVAAAWVAAEVAVYRRQIRAPSPASFAAPGCLAAGGLIFALSRTGGLWCDPGSWLQGHGFCKS